MMIHKILPRPFSLFHIGLFFLILAMGGCSQSNPFKIDFDSPGRRLVFEREGEIWLYDLDSGKEQKIIKNGERIYTGTRSGIFNQRDYFTRGFTEQPRWHPDGKKIVFVEHVVTDNWHLKILNLETGDFENIVGPLAPSGATPAWTPDGEAIIYSNRGVLTSINADGSDEQVLTAGPGPGYWCAWPTMDPMGEYLLYYGSYNVDSHIYYCNLSLDSTVKLTEAYFLAYHPEISPLNHSQGVFTATHALNGSAYIYLADSLNFSRAQLVSDTLVSHSSPTWSTDGSKIVYQIRVLDQTFDIWIMDPDGSNKELVINNGSRPSLWIGP